MAVKGKWAQGIEPRNFRWVMKDVFGVCERPGGYGANHRRVRRQEEIIWVREQGFAPFRGFLRVGVGMAGVVRVLQGCQDLIGQVGRVHDGMTYLLMCVQATAIAAVYQPVGIGRT